MSVCISTTFQISKDPCNQSKTKQLFSFPKEARFKQKEPGNHKICYEAKTDFRPKWIGNARDKSPAKSPGTSFGIGDRPQLFFNKQKEQKYKPAPCQYTLTTAFKPLTYAFDRKKVKTPRSQSGLSSSMVHAKAKLVARARQRLNTRNTCNVMSIDEYLEGQIDHQKTTFGVGRNVYKKVVSQTTRNYGEATEDIPGPGAYDAKLTSDLTPIGGSFSCTVQEALQSTERFSASPKSKKQFKKTISLN